MRFWSPTLNKINNILADLYLAKESTYRLVNQGGLEAADINFVDTAVDNWHNILLSAQKRGKLKEFLKYVVDESQSPDLTAAYDEFLKTSVVLGGNAPILPGAVGRFGRWLRRSWRRAAATAIVITVLATAAFAAYYYLIPVKLSGYVSCATPAARLGEHVPAATVRVPGTLYKAETDGNGAFTIKAYRPTRLDTLEVLYGMRPPQSVRPVEFKNNDLRVIACEYRNEIELIRIPFEWWKETPLSQAANPCQVDGRLSQVKLYTLETDQPIHRTKPGELVVNVVTLGRWEIVNATVTAPLNTEEIKLFAETTSLRGPNKRQWGFDIPGDNLNIRIQVCFGSLATGDLFSRDSLDSNYYFE